MVTPPSVARLRLARVGLAVERDPLLSLSLTVLLCCAVLCCAVLCLCVVLVRSVCCVATSRPWRVIVTQGRPMGVSCSKGEGAHGAYLTGDTSQPRICFKALLQGTTSMHAVRCGHVTP
jgi:hypothetical protein